jgi:hypothetical protein
MPSTHNCLVLAKATAGVVASGSAIAAGISQLIAAFAGARFDATRGGGALASLAVGLAAMPPAAWYYASALTAIVERAQDVGPPAGLGERERRAMDRTQAARAAAREQERELVRGRELERLHELRQREGEREHPPERHPPE